MRIKSRIREMVINAVQYAVREELHANTGGIGQRGGLAEQDEIIQILDKQVERWTWERYKRLENNDFPKLEKQLDVETWNLQKQIDKAIEKWTWDRYQRTDKSVEKWTWDRYQRTDKSVEKWTWDRYQRTDKSVEKWTWERFQRTKAEFDELAEQVDIVKQDMLELMFEKNRNIYSGIGKIKVVMLFQIPSCWPSVESVWDELVSDERFDATLLLYDREQKEKAQMAGAREFLIEHNMEFVEAEYYDFDKEKPHVFIYQTPWDDRHRPDFLKADAIKRKGIRIVYLPYGIEYSASVRLSWIFSIMQFKAKPWMSFALSPQVILEHKLQSKYGSDFLVATGLPKFDSLYEKERFNLSNGLLEKIKGRKIVFWQMHFPALDGNELYPEPNIEVYLQFAKKISEYDDLYFLARPHPKFFEMYFQKGFSEEVEQLKSVLTDTDNIYLYNESDYRPALVNSDYIIGDRSALMVEAIVLQVPVLYMTNFYYKEKLLSAVEPIFDSYYQGSECYDMELFIDMVVRKGNDYKAEERIAAQKLCVPYFDGQCGKRIVDCIAGGIYEEDR